MDYNRPLFAMAMSRKTSVSQLAPFHNRRRRHSKVLRPVKLLCLAHTHPPLLRAFKMGELLLALLIVGAASLEAAFRVCVALRARRRAPPRLHPLHAQLSGRCCWRPLLHQFPRQTFSAPAF